jgi:hypothetical protein
VVCGAGGRETAASSFETHEIKPQTRIVWQKCRTKRAALKALHTIHIHHTIHHSRLKNGISNHNASSEMICCNISATESNEKFSPMNNMSNAAACLRINHPPPRRNTTNT